MDDRFVASRERRGLWIIWDRQQHCRVNWYTSKKRAEEKAAWLNRSDAQALERERRAAPA